MSNDVFTKRWTSPFDVRLGRTNQRGNVSDRGAVKTPLSCSQTNAFEAASLHSVLLFRFVCGLPRLSSHARCASSNLEHGHRSNTPRLDNLHICIRLPSTCSE